MKTKKALLSLIFIVFFTFALSFLTPVNAYNPDAEGDLLGLEYGQYTGLSDTDVRFTVARIINVALGLLGIIMVVLMVYAGFLWMTAAGNEEKAGTARKIIFSAIIGLIIILSAYAISNFVVGRIYGATWGF